MTKVNILVYSRPVIAIHQNLINNGKSPRNKIDDFVFRVWSFLDSASDSNKVKTLYDKLDFIISRKNQIVKMLKDERVILDHLHQMKIKSISRRYFDAALNMESSKWISISKIKICLVFLATRKMLSLQSQLS